MISLSSVYNNDTTDMLFTRDAGGVDYVGNGGNCRSCKVSERILGNVSCAIRGRGDGGIYWGSGSISFLLMFLKFRFVTN